MEPFGPAAVLISGPGLFFAYDVTLGDSIPTESVGLPNTTTSVPWPGDRRFAIGLVLATDADQREIGQASPYATLVDEDGDQEPLGFACSPPVVTELQGLHDQLLSVGAARVGLWGGAEVDLPNKRLLIYDEDIGWADVPLPGDGTHARLAMLDDGSILAVGVDSPEQVWRWTPE